MLCCGDPAPQMGGGHGAPGGAVLSRVCRRNWDRRQHLFTVTIPWLNASRLSFRQRHVTRFHAKAIDARTQHVASISRTAAAEYDWMPATRSALDLIYMIRQPLPSGLREGLPALAQPAAVPVDSPLTLWASDQIPPRSLARRGRRIEPASSANSRRFERAYSLASHADPSIRTPCTRHKGSACQVF